MRDRRLSITPPDGGEVSALEFGATGDGVTDDTAALNEFLDYITTNKRAGFLPGANYRITAPLLIRSRPGWSLRGNGNRGTLITQDTDNTPILQLGDQDSFELHHFTISGLWFTYTNHQPPANTGAVCILHYDMAWQARFQDLGFKRGHYAAKVRPGIGCPWGTTWDDIHFGDDLTGGAMDWSKGINGVPNNHFGRFFVELGPMVGPVFSVRGYNFTWDTVEFIQAAVDTPKLFVFATGTHCQFGTFKVENSPLTVGKFLIEVPGDAYLDFGHVSWNGNGLGTANTTTGTAYLFAVGANATGDATVRVGSLTMYLAAPSTSPLYVYRAGNDDVSFTVDRLRLRDGWQLTNGASNPAAPQTARVSEWQNGRIATRGDVDHTVTLRGATTHRFTTPLTAPRTVTLPSDVNSLHNGVSYDLIFDGAINGSNTATVKAGAHTLRVQATDRVALRYTWAGGSVATGWVLVSYQTLP